MSNSYMQFEPEKNLLSYFLASIFDILEDSL